MADTVSSNDRLAKSFVTLTANLQRLSESEALVIKGLLKSLEQDIVSKLTENPDMSSWRKARYEALLSQTRQTIKANYTSIADQCQDYLTTVGTGSASACASIFSSIGIPLQSVIITDEAMASLATNSLINGSPARAWWAKQSTSLQDAFSQQMKIGYASGETVDQLVQRVRGRATGKRNKYIINGKEKTFVEFSGGIMDTGTRQAEALVRTATQQIGADAKMLMFRKNADILKGVMWLSTLDSRTTPLCRAHDGLLYDLDGKPIGHSVSFLSGPPAHWNCRSTLVPVTKSFEELGGTPGVTKEYLDQIGEGTRASMNGQVPDRLTFDSWFRTLPEQDQISFLGPKRWQIWKEAGLNFADMIDQRGNPLTIQQLADAYGFKIEQAKTTGIPNIPQEMVSAIAVEQRAQAVASELLAKQAAEEAAKAAAKAAAEAEATAKEAKAKEAAEAEAAQAEIKKISTSKNAFIKPVWDEYKDSLVGTPQEQLTFLQAHIKHERTAQLAWSKLDKTVKQAVKDSIASGDTAVYTEAMEQLTAMEQVKSISLPSQRRAAYKQTLAQLKQTNAYYKTALTEKIAKYDLSSLYEEWKTVYPSSGSAVPFWDYKKLSELFDAYVSEQDVKALALMDVLPSDPIEQAVAVAAKQSAMLKVPQGVPGSGASTLKQFDQLKKKMLKDEKIAQVSLSVFLEESEFREAKAMVADAFDKAVLPTEKLEQLKAAHQALTKEATKNLATAATATNPIEKKAYALFSADKNDHLTPISQWHLYQDCLKQAQQQAAKVTVGALEDIIGSNKFDGVTVTIGKMTFDVTDPAGLANFKKYKTAQLAMYKKKVLAGKKPSPSYQLVYDNLSPTEKTAFDDSVAKSLAKKKAAAASSASTTAPSASTTAPSAPAPPTSNAVPPPGKLRFSQMEKIGDQLGSNEGGFYRDKQTGIEYYVKWPRSEDIARNELLAGKLYEACGVEVPELTLLNDGGRVGIASKIKAGLKKGSASKLSSAIGAADNFAVDAWLANWDVVGLEYDNLMLTEAGTAFRVDVGGSLRYRAQGGLKGNAFGNVVSELESLRDSNVNRQSAAVFGKMDKAKLEAGVKKVLSLSDDEIKRLVREYGPVDSAVADELAETLIARKKYLAKKFPHLAKSPVVSAPAAEEGSMLVSEAQAKLVEEARINGYAIPADKDLIEDQNLLAWFEKDTEGRDFTGLRFKYTEQATDRIKNLLSASGTDDAFNTEVEKYITNRYYSALDNERRLNRYMRHLVSTNPPVKASEFVKYYKGEFKKMLRAYDDCLMEIKNKPQKLQERFLDKYKKIYLDFTKLIPEMLQKQRIDMSSDIFMLYGGHKFNASVVKDFAKEEFRAKWSTQHATKSLAFNRTKANFYQTKISGGYAVRTKQLMSRGGTYKEVMEATTADGIRVRIWPGDIGGRAFENQIEVLVPGRGRAALEKAMKLVETELDLPVSMPTAADRELLYLRQITRQLGFWDILEKSDIQMRIQLTTEDLVANLKEDLSKRMNTDVTKLDGYNPEGEYEAWGHSFRRWFLPGTTKDKAWKSFFEDYRLYHSVTNGNLISTLDNVLNSGGRMITTASKTRYGVPWGGMSPEADMDSGGADYFFTRLFKKDSEYAANILGGESFVWDSRLITRLDTISYASDEFGRTTGTTVRDLSVHGVSDLEHRCARRKYNETIFKNGLSLFDGLRAINCTSPRSAEQVLHILRKHGWTSTWVDGRPIEELVWINGVPYSQSK